MAQRAGSALSQIREPTGKPEPSAMQRCWPGKGMTHDERHARGAIRDTIARYTIAGDRLKVEDFIACFTDDAVIESEGVPEDRAFRYAGREAIRGWQERWLDAARQGRPVHAASFARHHLTTSQIDLTGPDTARARTYWQAWTDIGPDHAGFYLDGFRREGERWLIAHRRIRLDWEAEGSLFKNAVANTNPDRDHTDERI